MLAQVRLEYTGQLDSETFGRLSPSRSKHEASLSKHEALQSTVVAKYFLMRQFQLASRARGKSLTTIDDAKYFLIQVSVGRQIVRDQVSSARVCNRHHI